MCKSIESNQHLVQGTSNSSKQRQFSERRPRSSSTTSAEDTLNGAIGNRRDLVDELHDSEPFSQVFINRTKERMLKKKHKANGRVTTKQVYQDVWL